MLNSIHAGSWSLPSPPWFLLLSIREYRNDNRPFSHLRAPFAGISTQQSAAIDCLRARPIVLLYEVPISEKDSASFH